MAKRIEPMKPPGEVRPIREDEVSHSVAWPGETLLFETWARDHVRRSGTEILYFCLDEKNSKVDPLYGEAGRNKAWVGPYKLHGFVEWPDAIPEQREEGLRSSWAMKAWIAREEFEQAGTPYPVEGDVVQIWSSAQYFDTAGSLRETVPNAGYFFNVVDADDDAHLFDNPDFVGFSFELRRNTEFAPERRVRPP